MKWTTTEQVWAIRLCIDGHDCRQIGQLLRRTPESIRKQLARRGLSINRTMAAIRREERKRLLGLTAPRTAESPAGNASQASGAP